jgi:hypothetical protein
MVRRWLIVLTLTLAVAAHADADPAAEAVREGVRKAVGYEAFRKLEHGVELGGKAEFNGLPGTFRLRLHPDGRYATVIDAKAAYAEGFDGKTRWTRTFTNPATPTDLVAADAARFYYGFLTHRWLAPDGGFTAATDPRESRPYRPCVVVRHPDCPGVAARVYTDPTTGLPTRYSVFIGPSESVVEVADWRDVGGAKIPGRVAVGRYAGGYILAADTAAAAAPAGADVFALPAPAADIRFDPAKAPAAEAQLTKKLGFLLVRPTVNGKAGPWLALTTSASSSAVTAAAADALGLPVFGKTAATRLGGIDSRFRVADTFAVGPAAVSGLVLIELPADGMAELSKQAGVEIGGVLGGDLLARVVLEADWGAGTAAVHDPRAYRAAPGLAWEAVRFGHAAPCVSGTFEGRHTGLFEFATATDGTLMFTPGAVRGRDLLAGRQTEPFLVHGVDGATQAYRGTGAEFRVLGRTLRQVETRFVTGEFGVETYPYALGAFGPAALGPGTVVFDYPNRRIGFTPRP